MGIRCGTVSTELVRGVSTILVRGAEWSGDEMRLGFMTFHL